ncbi:MAG: DUF1194 domain-containing protein [Proteobacteria bacterium]|nr:DUF1194 domain-containing protein [Pseudomonadota bacterium]
MRRSAVARPVVPVSCALVLAVDVSSSIDGEHWWLQRKGYAEAFLHPQVMRAIQDTPKRRIAVSYFEWSGANSQRVIVPWTVVGSEEGGGGIADTLLTGRRPFEGSTAVGATLDFAMDQLTLCPFAADQQVIDVSGDGGNNDGPEPEAERDRAARTNIRVNGLPIDWARSHPPMGMTIGEYYRASVIGGPNAFAMPAVGFDSFGYALAAKLRREIAALPAATESA